jgi:thiol-disulfide isomerase/thioredoxin
MNARMIASGIVLALLGCGDRPAEATPAASATATIATPAKVGYDLRRLRPRDQEKLVDMFDRLRAQASKDGKLAAVLFSADWCEPCRTLELELGNTAEAAAIGDVRIFELKEEDWEAATRMDEFNELRKRWDGRADSYPLFIALDGNGAKREEMREAIERLGSEGVEPTVPNWLRGLPR